MDQHPIPQDVTGFQFKLIGTMTVKQFGYVASGVILAVVLFYLPLQGALAPLVKLMFIPLFGASGVVVAFVPIDGRPVDTMTTNFVKALFSPNQYVYHRLGRKMSFSTVTVIKAPALQKNGKPVEAAPVVKKHTNNKEEQLRAFLMSSQGGVKNELDKKEADFLKAYAAPIQIAQPNIVRPMAKAAAPAVKTAPIMPKPAVLPTHPKAPLLLQQKPVLPVKVTPVAAPTPVQSAPSSKLPETPEALAKQETVIEQQLTQAKQEEAKPLPVPAHDAAHTKVETLEQQLLQIHNQKQQLEQEIAKLHTQLSEQKSPVPAVAAPTVLQTAPVQPASAPKPVVAPVIKPAIPIQDPHMVRIVPASTATNRTDLPRVSDTPNVVVGIVKDPRGNVLSNILVEVKDREGNPVRAFKTNPLGQFASATPLSPGVYTLELEDPKKLQKFDVIQITANNQIMRPIEIISHDAREELRQQLFAN